MSTRTYSYTVTDSDVGPALVDFDVWRGYNFPPAIWGPENDDGTPFPTDGSEFVLTIRFPTGPVSKSTNTPGSGFTHNPRTSELTWDLTVAESRLIPPGPNTKYEIERILGDDNIPFVLGLITGQGGINDD